MQQTKVGMTMGMRHIDLISRTGFNLAMKIMIILSILFNGKVS